MILLGLISANRSALIGGLIFFLAQLFGWGLYVLPVGLIGFGLWLVFRKIERIPPLSIERAAGSVLLFVWLLTAVHATFATLDNATATALAGRGGGYVGSFFQRAIWSSLGGAGALVAMLAGLLIALTMALDISVQDLFRRIGPFVFRLRDQWKRLAGLTGQAVNTETKDGYAPIPSPLSPSTSAQGLGGKGTGVRGEGVCLRHLPTSRLAPCRLR